MPNTFQGQNRKNIATSKSSPRRKKNTKKRVKKEPPKLAYHMTDEENELFVRVEVKTHFAPKKKEQKQTFDPETVKWAKGFLEQPSQYDINKPDDYIRALKKVDASKPRSCTGSGLPAQRGIAQLGEQAK